MSATPEPLTPADCDLRDFPFMPLDVVRLRDSDLAAVATAEEFRCAVLLWCASWHQTPAASLPDDDAILANLAGFGRAKKEWQRYREGALRGWIKCADGRFYHPVVAEKAMEAMEKRRKQSKRGASGAAKRWRKHENTIAQASPDDGASNSASIAEAMLKNGKGEERRGKEGREESPLPPKGGARELELVPFDDLPDAAEEAFVEFRKLASEFGLSTPKKLEPDRRKAIKARIADHGAGAPATAFAAIRASPFLRGEKGADGWKGVTLDWLFKPTNFRKVIEGNYDERSANQQSAALERLEASSPRRGQIEDIASLALRDFNRN